MILFIDIDGTIREYSAGIIPSAVHALEAARERHTLILCTGRTIGMIPYDVPLDVFHGMIAGGGAYMEYDGKVLKDECIPEETVRRYRSFFDENDIPYAVEGKRGAYFGEKMAVLVSDLLFGGEVNDTEKSPALRTERIDIRKRLDEAEGMGVSKLGFCLTPAQYEKFSVPENSGLTFIHFTDSTDGYEHCELVRSDSDKGAAVAQMLDILGRFREEAYAFGDSSNDISMMDECGTSVCMGNADEAVKVQADVVTDHVLDDGFKNALVRLGLIDE